MSCKTPLSTTLQVLVLAIIATIGACEEEAVTHADVGVALMTIGSIGFMMGLFYLVNHHDEDMRKYSWQVISNTISIFSAVLLFQAVNGVLKHYALKGTEENSGIQLFVGIVHFMVWYVLLQVLLAAIVGAIDAVPFWELFCKDETAKNALPSEVEQKTKLMLECWAVLMGHITAFAAINMFGIIQQMMSKWIWLSALAVPLAWVLMEMLFALAVFLRQREIAKDNKKDEREKLWIHHTKETEDDVIGLCISFLIVQVLRFIICGVMPDVEGEDGEGTPDHTIFDSLYLIGIGMVWIAARLVRTAISEHHLPFSDRKREQIGLITTMGAAWCLLFSVQWTVNIYSHHTKDAVAKVVIALAVTFLSLGDITILDKIRDRHATSKRVDKILKSFITTLSMLIGFAWEKCFDSSVDTIAHGGRRIFPPVATKLILSILLCSIVIPAWRFFILPTIMEYEEKEEEEEEEEEKEGEEGEEEEGGEGEPKDEEAQVTSRDLGAPLLQNEASSTKAPLEKMSLVGLTVPALKKKVREAETKLREANEISFQKDKENVELMKKNAELETSLSAVAIRLQKLQERAEMLRSPKQ